MWYLIPQDGPINALKEKFRRERITFQEVEVRLPYRLAGLAVPLLSLEPALRILGMSDENIQKVVSDPRKFGSSTNIDSLFALDFAEFSLGPKVVKGRGDLENWNDIQTALTEYAGKLNLRIIVSNPHGSSCSPDKKPNTLFVKFFSVPSGEARRRGMTRAFGRELTDGQRNGLHPPGGGLVISDDSGTEVAEIAEGNIYILFDLPHGGGVMGLIRNIMDKATGFLLSPDKRKEHEKQERDQQRELYVQHCSQRIGQEMRESKDQLERCQRELASQEMALVSAARQREEVERRIALFSAEEEGLRADFLEEFEKIKATAGVEATKVTGETLQIFTDEILIEDNGAKYRIGKFRIDIFTKGSSGGVKCWNLTGKIMDKEKGCEFQHPHVEMDGICCLGNAKLEVLKLIGASQYPLVVQIMLNFLRSYNEADKFSDLRNFPVA